MFVKKSTVMLIGLAGTIALLALSFYLHPVKTTTEIPGELYIFEPRPDITVYELAKLLQQSKYHANKEFVDSLPESVQRHFKKVKK